MTEMQKLTSLLMLANIPHEVKPHRFFPETQIIFYPSEKDRVCDAVCFWGSYGGEWGLLEIMGLTRNHDEVEGYLRAEEVYERIYHHWKGER